MSKVQTTGAVQGTENIIFSAGAAMPPADAALLAFKIEELEAESQSLSVRLDEFTGYFAWASRVASGTSYDDNARVAHERLATELTAAQQALANNDLESAGRHVHVAQALVPCVSQLIDGLAHAVDDGADDLKSTWQNIAVADAFVGTATAAALWAPAVLGATATRVAVAVAGSLAAHSVSIDAYSASTKIIPEHHSVGPSIMATDIGINTNTTPKVPVKPRTPIHKLKSKEELIALAQQGLRDFHEGRTPSVDMAEFFIHAELAQDEKNSAGQLDGYLGLWQRKKAGYQAALEQNDKTFSELFTGHDVAKEFKDDVLSLRASIIGPTQKFKYNNGLARFTDFLRMMGDSTNGVNCEGQGVPLTIVAAGLIQAVPQPYVLGIQAYERHVALAVLNRQTQNVWDIFYNRIDTKINAPIYSPAYLFYTYLIAQDIRPVVALDDLLIADMNVPLKYDALGETPPTNTILSFVGNRGTIDGTAPDEATIDFNFKNTPSETITNNPLTVSQKEFFAKDVITADEALALGFEKFVLPFAGAVQSLAKYKTGYTFGIILDGTGKNQLVFFDKRDRDQFLDLMKIDDPQNRQAAAMAFLLQIRQRAFAQFMEDHNQQLKLVTDFLSDPVNFKIDPLISVRDGLSLYQFYFDVITGEDIGLKAKYNWFSLEDLEALAQGENDDDDLTTLRKRNREATFGILTIDPLAAAFEEKIHDIVDDIRNNPNKWVLVLNSLDNSRRGMFFQLLSDLDAFELDDYTYTTKHIMNLFTDPKVIGVFPAGKTNPSLADVEPSTTFRVTYWDRPISDEELTHRPTLPKPEPFTGPKVFSLNSKDYVKPEITVSIDFVMSSLFSSSAEALRANWTPAMSEALYRSNRNGKYDDIFIKCYADISQQRLQAHPDLITGEDIIYKIAEAYKRHGIDLWNYHNQKFNYQTQEWEPVELQSVSNLAPLNYKTLSYIEDHLYTVYTMYKTKLNFTDEEMKAIPEGDPRVPTSLYHIDPNLFGRVPLDFVPILADIMRRSGDNNNPKETQP